MQAIEEEKEEFEDRRLKREADELHLQELRLNAEHLPLGKYGDQLL